MGLLADDVVRAYLAQPAEIPAALAHARSCGLQPIWDEDTLILRVQLHGLPASAEGEQPIAVPDITPELWSEPFLIEGVFDDYRVLPPIWRYLDHRTGAPIGQPAYPSPRGNSVLHSNGLICAHFSRMAYNEHNGPHAWNGVRSWQTPVEGTVALTISDMLARLIWETRYNSHGRMAPLPPCAIAA